MASISMKVSSKQASDYPYQKDAVFSPDKPGESTFWLDNKGAEKFGLDPSVKANFSEVVNIMFGMDKTGTERTSGKNADDHFKNGATETVLTCGKSISIMCTVDKDLGKDVIEGYKKTAYFISTLVEGRETVNGVTRRVHVDAPMLFSPHGVARLSKEDLALGRVEDPQIHAHVVTANNSEHENGKTGAIENLSIKQNEKVICQFRDNNSARATLKNGYEIEWHKDERGNFYAEEKTITEEQREAFSNRNKSITKAKNGNDSLDSDKKAQLSTKADKISNRTIEELNTSWKETRQLVGIDAESIRDKAHDRLNHISVPDNKLSIGEIVTIAISDVNSKESKFRIQDVMLDALKMSRASYDPADVIKGVHDAVKSGELVKHGELYTSPEMIKMESGIVKTASDNIHEFNPLMSKENADKVVTDFEAEKKFTLSQGQADAVRMILTTDSRINIINGAAGTGKTTSMEAVYLALKDNPDIELVGMAPSNSAVIQLQNDSGIKSQTIDSYVQKEREPLADGKMRVIILDEASMVGSENMAKLFDAEKNNLTKIILVGDINQLAPVSAGQPFKDLQATNVPKTFITEVQRQVLNSEGTNQYSYDATNAFQNHKIQEGFQILKDAGKIIETNTGRDELIQATAKAYIEANQFEGDLSYKKQLKLVGCQTLTNAERLELGGVIRDIQRENGLIGKEIYEYSAERAINMGSSEKRQAINYEVGNFVNVLKDMRAGGITIKAGSVLEIVDRDVDKNTITYNVGGEDNNIKFNPTQRAELNRMKLDGTTIEVSTVKDGSKLAQFEVCQEQMSLFEKRIFTDTDKSDFGKANQFIKDTTYMAIDRDERTGTFTIALDNGKIVKGFDPEGTRTGAGAVTTGHKSQGKTYGQNINMLPSFSVGMINENIAYVLESRQSDGMVVITDNLEAVVKAAMEAQEKTTTNDGSIIQYPATDNQPINNLSVNSQDTSNKPLEMEESKYSFESMSKKMDNFMACCENIVNTVLFPEPPPPENSPILSVEATPPEKAVDLLNEQLTDKALDQEHTQGQESGSGHDKGNESIAEVAQDNDKGLQSQHDDDEPEPEKVRHQSFEMSM